MWLLKYLKTSRPDPTYNIKNFGFVNKKIRRGGQPEPNSYSYRWLKQSGVQHIINLVDVPPKDVFDDEISALTVGLTWAGIPMSDSIAPSVTAIKRCLTELIFPADRACFIHCKGGRHRTGLVIAVYRVVVDRWSKEEAWEEAERYGFYSIFGHGDLKKWFFDKFHGGVVHDTWVQIDYI